MLSTDALPDAALLLPGPEALPGTRALMSTRAGGCSAGPWASLNLGDAVGDAPAAVAANRARLAAWMQAQGASSLDAADPAAGLGLMRQVHGSRVLRWGSAGSPGGAPRLLGDWTRPAGPGSPLRWRAADPRSPGAEEDLPQADACISTVPGLPCLVQVADCLPLLLAAPGPAAGRAVGVGAAHAGWRGLAAGVIEATVQALAEASGCAPGALSAWIGPCIGPRAFEVGPEVLRAFGASPELPAPFFRPVRPQDPGDPAARWWGDLPALARDRLQAAGLTRIAGGAWCTVSDPARFYAFRRDGVTGRMAAAVWIPQGPDAPRSPA